MAITDLTLEQRLEFWTAKATKLRLLGEHEIYKWEYDTCLENIALLKRLLQRRQERRRLRSSSTKGCPSTS